MNQNPNTDLVELVAAALGRMTEQFVLIGGCAVGLLITDKGRPPVRATIDVDLTTEVLSLGAYYDSLSPQLRECGFSECKEDGVMCRWRKQDLILDVVPSEIGILGYTNRWYKDTIKQAQAVKLANGIELKMVTAPLFIATKLEAFHNRAKGDYFHHDMEDILAVVDGRVELADEVLNETAGVKNFIKDEIEDLLQDPVFLDHLPGLFRPDSQSQQRIGVVLERLRRLAGL